MSATNSPTPAPAPNTAPIPTPPYAPNPTDYTYNWGQISAGPQAIAFKAVMQLAGLLTQIMDMYNKQASTQLNVQSQAALAGATATITAAQQQSYQTIAEAANSFASATVSAGGMVGSRIGTEYKTLNEATENKAGLDKLQASFTKVKIAAPAGGSVGTMNPATPPRPEVAPGAAHPTQRVNERIAQLISGGPSLVTAAKTIGTADDYQVKGDSSSGSLTETALKHMSQNGQLDQFSEKLTSAQDANAKEINNWHTAQQTLQGKIQMGQSMANGLCSAITQGVSANYQQKAGQEQATATLANNNAQQAGSMASTSQGLISKFYDEELQAYSMLQQIAATATVRG